MQEKFLGLDIDLDTSIDVGTIIFRPSGEVLAREMRLLGWTIDFKIASIECDDRGKASTTFEAELRKNGELMTKAEWDDELTEVVRGRVVRLENLGVIEGGSDER